MEADRGLRGRLVHVGHYSCAEDDGGSWGRERTSKLRHVDPDSDYKDDSSAETLQKERNKVVSERLHLSFLQALLVNAGKNKPTKYTFYHRCATILESEVLESEQDTNQR